MIDKDLVTKILYVEDDPNIRENIEKLLKRRYSQVRVCEDGVFGLETFNSFNPDVIISDILMPRMTGLEMSAKIREIDSDVPIILTTAHSDSDHLVKSIDIGITHYVIKPIDLNSLFGFIEKSKKASMIERELSRTRKLFESITQTSVSGIFVFNENFTYTNPEFQKISGYEEDELKEMCFSELFGDDFKTKAEEIVQKVKDHKEIDNKFFEAQVTTKNGSKKWLLIGINIIYHEDDYIGTGSIVDITATKELEAKLKRLATIDALTGAMNRNGFEDVYKQEISRSIRYKRNTSLVMLDIDYFKKINDTYGHSIGDYVLEKLGQLIKEQLRNSDSFVRWGGEEFILFLPETNLNGAISLAEIIRKTIEDFNFKKVGTITISLGVAHKNDDETRESLIERADTFLYKAKENGRNRVVFE